jgi:CubicO group peptidase (beta-lactamase class C family)
MKAQYILLLAIIALLTLQQGMAQHKTPNASPAARSQPKAVSAVGKPQTSAVSAAEQLQTNVVSAAEQPQTNAVSAVGKPQTNAVFAFAQPQTIEKSTFTQPHIDHASPGPQPRLLSDMHRAILNKEYPNIHSVLVSHKGKLVYEQYYRGKDEALGDDLGEVNHAAGTLHDMRSVTKSVVSICVGLAIQQGKIKSVSEKIMSFFPGHKDLDTGMRSQLTIKHLLTMSSGMEWNENLPYTDTLNSELAMSASADPVRFILTRTVAEMPGKSFSYNGGNTQLISAILEKTTGLKLDEFAAKYLFAPLDIKAYSWYTISDTNKTPAAASGLRLRSRDMLKIGALLADGGMYKGKRLLSKSWVDESFASHVARNDGGGYGYQFWIFTTPGSDRRPLPVAVGNGDQRVFIDRVEELVVVVTAGNYNKWDLKKASYELLSDFIYPALVYNR